MSIIVFVDLFLIENVFERFAHWFQRLTGKTNFWLANVSLLLIIFTVGMDSALDVAQGNMFGAFCLTFFSAITVPIFRFATYIAERRSVPGMRNGSAIDPISIFIRIAIFLIPGLYEISPVITDMTSQMPLSIRVIGHWVDLVQSCGFICFFYFMACTPLPPRKSKMKQWAEKLSETWSSIWEPSPQPA